MGQVLKLIAAKPDAVLIAGAGTPSALPQKTLLERGYGGVIYQTHGIGTLEFLQVGGKDVEGTLFPTGPGVVARELPDSNPVKQVAVAFADKYEAQYGAHADPVRRRRLWRMDAAGFGRGPRPEGRPQARHAGIPQGAARRVESTRNLAVPNGVFNISRTTTRASTSVPA